jgi:hypothetical protein
MNPIAIVDAPDHLDDRVDFVGVHENRCNDNANLRNQQWRSDKHVEFEPILFSD